MSIHKGMAQQIVAYNGSLQHEDRTNYLYTQRHDRILQTLCCKKPDPHIYMWYNSIYMKYEKRQKQSMVIENKIDTALRGGDWLEEDMREFPGGLEMSCV